METRIARCILRLENRNFAKLTSRFLKRLLERFPFFLAIGAFVIGTLFFSLCGFANTIDKNSNIETDNKSKVAEFASIKVKEVNFRKSPRRSGSIERICKCQNLPVQIHREFEHWKLVSDFWGNEGWVHVSMLSKKRTAIAFDRKYCATGNHSTATKDMGKSKDNTNIERVKDNAKNDSKNNKIKPVCGCTQRVSIITNKKQVQKLENLESLEKLKLNGALGKSDSLKLKDAHDEFAIASLSAIEKFERYLVIRRLPYDKAAPIARVSLCSIVHIAWCNNEWCYIHENNSKLNNKKGWIKKEYLWGVN